MMKNLLKLSTALLLAGIVFVSCEKEKTELSITNVVAENHDGGSEIALGGTISVNFTATAGDDARTFKGLRNANVHAHVTVPDTANLGSYHVVIVVVDEAGNSVDTEDLETHITIVE